jgi:hypothetical protein
MTMVVGIFDSLVEVQRAVADLIDAGYARNTISILIRDGHLDTAGERRGFEEPANGENHQVATLDGAEAVVDVVKTAKVLAGGPLATVLRQSSLDHPEGPVVRALTSAGLGLTSARYFTEAICNGAVLVAVHCEDRYVRDTRDLLDAHATLPHNNIKPSRASRLLAGAP